MNDTQIGFRLVACCILLVGAIWGFRKARGDARAWGTLQPSFVVTYSLIAYVWNMGLLAIYPSFVEGEGRNAFIAFSFLMAVMTAIAVLATFLLWYHLFKLFHWIAKQYCAAMVPRTGRR